MFMIQGSQPKLLSVERMTGFEPATLCLGSTCATNCATSACLIYLCEYRSTSILILSNRLVLYFSLGEDDVSGEGEC